MSNVLPVFNAEDTLNAVLALLVQLSQMDRGAFTGYWEQQLCTQRQ